MSEDETDVVSAPGTQTSRSESVTERISGRRWLAGGLVVIFLFLALAGFLDWTVALIAVVAVIALLALVPRASGPTGALRIDLRQGVMPTVEEGIASFVAALPDPCYVLDRRGTVLVVNPPATELFSVRVGDPLTTRLRLPDLLAAFTRVADGGEPERVEFVERVPTERWFAGWFAGMGPYDEQQRPELIVLIIGDLTEQHRADRVRVDFVANASHELRTPLASLAGFIETLQGPARNDPEARDRFLAIMHEQATRMSRLIDDLLSLSRIEMKAHLSPREPVNLADIVRHVADALDPLARDLGVSVSVSVPDDPVPVIGDEDELIQVFENLIENACKYGQTGRRVEVTVTPGGADDGGSVTVRDFGPGIPEEHLPRLTERFYRIDVEASRRHRGTGLGLAIVKHILARHQARLAIDSTVGEGASFRVTFPQPSEQQVAEEGMKAQVFERVGPS